MHKAKDVIICVIIKKPEQVNKASNMVTLTQEALLLSQLETVKP